MIAAYKMPVVVEKFIDGPEITVVVFDDGAKKHVFMGEKIFKSKPDGKHFFTSHESYDDENAYDILPALKSGVSLQRKMTYQRSIHLRNELRSVLECCYKFNNFGVIICKL